MTRRFVPALVQELDQLLLLQSGGAADALGQLSCRQLFNLQTGIVDVVAETESSRVS